jgi:hypothetical protein
MASQQHIRALLELGWSHRRIAREAVARYALRLHSKPANPIAGSAAAAPYHEFIQTGVNQGLTAQRIWQDLGAEQGYGHS